MALKDNKRFLGSGHVLNGSPETNVYQPAGDTSSIGEIVKSKIDDVDAALVELDNNMSLIPQQFDSDVVITKLDKATCRMPVEKSGIGTGVTAGVVAGLGEYEVELEHDNWIEVQGFRIIPTSGKLSAPGDSGSIWYLADGDKSQGVALGLHVAGEVDQQLEMAIASDILEVFDDLGLSAEDDLPAAIQTSPNGHE